jgi:hypothetical protein
MKPALDREIDSALGVAETREKRRNLAARDGASIDQLEAGLSEAFRLAQINGRPSGVAALIGATSVSARADALLAAGRIDQATADAVSHCAQEVRMALVGILS